MLLVPAMIVYGPDNKCDNSNHDDRPRLKVS